MVGSLGIAEQELNSSDVVAATGLMQSCATFLVPVVYVAPRGEQQLQDPFSEAWVPLRLTRDVVLADLASVDHRVLIKAVRYLRIWRKTTFQQSFD